MALLWSFDGVGRKLQRSAMFIAIEHIDLQAP